MEVFKRVADDGGFYHVNEKGQAHGLCVTTLSGGLRNEVNYENDLKHGEYKLFYENGSIFMHSMFREDVAFGEIKSYDAQGVLNKHCIINKDDVVLDITDETPLTEELKFLLSIQGYMFLPEDGERHEHE